jgi:DNA-binding NtrC family response regulator
MQTLLLVDDDPNFCSAARELLEMLDYDVTTADSVATARETLNNQQFDRVFLDLMLPDGSGLHVLDAIPKRQLKDIQVTIVTGHPALKGMVKTADWSQVNYLIKPIDLEKLKNVLNAPPPEKELPAKHSESIPAAAEKHFGYLIGESELMHTSNCCCSFKVFTTS